MWWPPPGHPIARLDGGFRGERVPTIRSMASIAAVVPCYNGEAHLAEALESIHAQTRPADEVIVVDDGSTDDSARVAEWFGARVLRQSNMGEAGARNAGIEAASSDFVAWLDADDRWRPQHLRVVGGLLEHNPAAVAAFGAVQRFGSRDELILGYVPPGPPAACLDEAFSDWLHTPTGSVTRRSALVALGGFDTTERYAVDFDLWLRLARRHRFVATHEVTSEWRWHDAQQSSHTDAQLSAVYRYRQRFLGDLRREGESALADALEEDLPRAWVRDVRESMDTGDRASLRLLRDVASTIPTLTTRDRLVWCTATRVPRLVRASLGARRRLKAVSRP